ncbi:MAG: Tol-Pal system beta propeller repeat protein TolB [Deltaproteobacteria bacterium]|nr:MAG: Tol-Pal system beta propeller repeat protein TolB [Deltaproteobacteria bacterium]
MKIVLILIGLICALSSSALAEDYIPITPFIKKIPIAIPAFKQVSGTAAEKGLATETHQLMTETLSYTGYFKFVDPKAFLEEPARNGIVAAKINFANWKGIGAELLITTGIRVRKDRLALEFRLFDAFKERMLVGKVYKGNTTESRIMVRRFCSEVILRLTGSPGIFDSKIAYLDTKSGHKEVMICDFDGFNPQQITTDKSICLSPAWSSDGQWLAYTSYVKGKPDLYIRNLWNQEGWEVNFDGLNITPAWIPGKFELAATLSFSGDQEIYRLTGRGKMIKRLTNKWGIDVSPSFSPDGSRMAFVSNRSGSPQIYIRDMQTEKVQRLTFEGKYNTSPSWSPKDDKIAYAGMEKGVTNIFVIKTDGSGLMQLTAHSGSNESPSFSPDGTLIAFSSTREGKSRIYVMTAFGTDQRRVTSGKGEQSNPKWSPAVIRK